MIRKQIKGHIAAHVLGVLLSISAIAAQSQQTMATPVRPADDALVLATVPQSAGETSPLRAAQAALANDSGNVELAVAAARLGIEEGRAKADPRFYGQAQAALSPWWDSTNPPEEVRVLRAVILQAFHDFTAATADLDAILETSPGNAQARLSRAFVRMVSGDAAGAGEDCASLPRRIEPVILHLCQARVEALTGQADRGFARLEKALAFHPPKQSSMYKFALAVMAEIAVSLGRGDEAEKLYSQASAMDPPEASLLAAQADLLLDLNRPAEVLALLEGGGEADILVLRQAIAAKRLNDPRFSRWSDILAERFAAAEAGGVRVHMREEARFRLEVLADAPGALALALRNWQVQKEPIDARLLVDCAIAANRPDAAADVKNFIARTGIADIRITKALARLEEHRS